MRAWFGLLLVLTATPALAADAARLMGEAVREVAALPNAADRAGAAIAVARIQAQAGLAGHARDALRQTADAVWHATPRADQAAVRAGLLAETAEAQCELDFKPDAGRVLDVAAKTLPSDATPARARLLRAALFCGDRARAAVIEAPLAARPSAAAALAFARHGLPARAEAMLRQAPTERAAAADVAALLARLGYRAFARRIDPATPAAAVPPDVLAQAQVRRRVGDRAGARAFLAIAHRRIETAPAFKPALAIAYAELDLRREAAALVRAGGDGVAARAAIAASFVRAGDAGQARAWLKGLQGPETVAALAGLARATGDADIAAEAERRARMAPAGRARAEALAYAATARIDGAAK